MPRPPKRTPEEARIGRREAVKRYAERHPEIVQARTQAWRDANREHISAYDKDRRSTEEFKKKSQGNEKERYAKDPETGKARAAGWRQKNAAILKEVWKKQRAKNPEKRKENNRRWKREHPEEVKAAEKAWREANPEKTRLYGHERRAIQRGSGGKVTVAEIQDLWKKQDGKCVYYAVCGNILTDKGPYAAQRDHIEPLKPIDPTKPPGKNSIENIALLCGLCNRRKKNNDPYAFTQRYEGRLFPDLPQKANR